MIVCKFGGTSVGSAGAIRRLAEIVRGRAAERPVVVVSALSGVTNALLDLADSVAAADTAALDAGLAALAARHRAVAEELGLDPAVPAELECSAAALGTRLGGSLGASPDAELLDLIAGHGELWASKLVAGALDAIGLDAVWIDVREAMLTDDRFGRAAPDREALARRAPEVFGPALSRGAVPVTQGYVGRTADGRATTLGRGGSDFTASLLGAALVARRVEIWTDVSGLMTADPRIVPDARPLALASHLEAAELAAFGARVLHPATAAPLFEAGIPCVVLNTFAPEDPGTTILSDHRPEPVGTSPVRSISCKQGVTVVNVRAPAMLDTPGYLARFFAIFARLDVSVDVLATSEVNISCTVDEPERVEELRAALEELGEVEIFPARAIIGVVGIDLRGTRGLAARIFSAVRGINIEIISQGASEINVTFVVREEDGPKAVRLLHDEFFGREAA
ncbi:MAG: aspartate kinase [Gemmatimonadales bacterium]